ncbi:type IV secretion system DNA-binding domain-containing protein [Burkholderia ubonensis]|uniref:AAA+ ATPase domain-containing protein n=1 Tax=Burkholderia ubonensis TaxID=101571 RepID=A0A1R1J7X7_9BURK|nr:type IV secretion system DNA-binding domain-containing protein [Burkholderia ubonensis]OMG71393.1 hypothetical protein BW685_21365 [Burkholderia ubonensis]
MSSSRDQIRAALGKPPLNAPVATGPAATPTQAAVDEAFPPIRLGTEVIPRDILMRHLLIYGASGAGKTQALQQVYRAVRKRDEPFIAVDHGGEMTQRIYREGVDVILNPKDVRGAHFSPFFEIKSTTDFENVADAMIQRQSAADAFWEDMAKFVLACVLEALWRLGPAFRTNEALLAYLVEGPQRGQDNKESLEWLLARTPAARFFDAGSERMLSNILSMVARSVAPLKHYLGHTGEPFSITDYALSWETPGACRRALLLTYTDANKAALAPLIAMQVRFFVQAALRLSENDDRNGYLFLDELASLPPMVILYDATEKLRKRGVAIIGGLQSNKQLERNDRYGIDGAASLRSNFFSILALGVADPHTAEEMSLTFGDVRAPETNRTDTYSEDSSSTSYATSMKTERLLLPVQFMLLKPLEGYLRIGGRREVVPLTGRHAIPYYKAPIVCPPEIARAETVLDLNAPWPGSDSPDPLTV